jgi:hypothetical protein
MNVRVIESSQTNYIYMYKDDIEEEIYPHSLKG